MRLVRAAAVGLLLTAAAACTETPDDDTKIAWAGELCAVVTAASGVLTTPPPVADPADPDALRAVVETFLTTVTSGLTAAVDAASALRASPVEGGDVVAGRAAEAYRVAREPLSAALTTLRGDQRPGATLTVLAEIVPRITSTGPPEPLRGDSDSEFTRWAQEAPQCAEVPALRR